MRNWLERQWYRWSIWHLLLLPLSLLFWLVSGTRRALYRSGWKHSEKLSVPVIVIGNISVGGTGKTPLTIALVALLQEAGYHPGVISQYCWRERPAARCGWDRVEWRRGRR